MTCQYASNAIQDIPNPPLTGDWWVLGRSSPTSDGGDSEASLASSLSVPLTQPFNPDFDFGNANLNPPGGFYQPWFMRWTFGGGQGYSCSGG